jgi:hypothetical protein
MKRYSLHFPEGHARQWINQSYCEPTFRIGEGVVFDNGKRYRITDIQTQLREKPKNDAGTEVCVIMMNVFLELDTTHNP